MEGNPQSMSWEARKWADQTSENYQLDASTTLVLDRMASHADKTGDNIFPSLATLERETRLSERTIRRSIIKLLDLRLIEYGDQTVVSENPRYRNDQLPKVYRLVFNRDAAGMLDFSSFGREKPRKRKPWQRRPKPAPAPAPVDKVPAPPVENPPAADPRPDTVSRTPGQTTRHHVHQTVKPSQEPLTPAPAEPAGPPVPASPEVIDYAAVAALRQASRARLAQRGIHITAPLWHDTPEPRHDTPRPYSVNT
jgi:hypothetical protein